MACCKLNAIGRPCNCNTGNPMPGCDTPTKSIGECSREPTFREMLDQHIEQTLRNLRQLQALSEALPMTLPHNADRALRDMLARTRTMTW